VYDADPPEAEPVKVTDSPDCGLEELAVKLEERVPEEHPEVHAPKNSVIAGAPASFEVSEGNPQTVSRVLK